MTTSGKFLVACVLVALPAVAFAQSADVKYCAALADKYNDYVGTDDLGRGQTNNPVNIDVAVEKCKHGDVSGIPILEKILKDRKVTLPPRP